MTTIRDLLVNTEDTSQDVDDDIIDKLDTEVMIRRFHSLPFSERRLLELLYTPGSMHQLYQAGVIMGISTAEARVLLNRALARIELGRAHGQALADIERGLSE